MTLSAQQGFCFFKVCDRRVVFSDVVIGIGAIKKESKLAGFVWVGFGIPLDRFLLWCGWLRGGLAIGYIRRRRVGIVM
jgi:hypothetical protein